MNPLKVLSLLPILLWLPHAGAQTTLEAYVDTALQNNPSLKSYGFRAGALQQKVSPAKTLMDPMVEVGVMNLPLNFSFTDEMMTMKQISLQQSFPVSKKNALSGSVAQTEFEAGTYDFQEQELLLARQVKWEYFELFVQTRSIEITQDNIEVMKTYLEIANTRYSTGQGTQQDILKAQLELSKMQVELITMQSRREDLVAIFNTLLNRDRMEPVDVPEEISYNAIDAGMETLMEEAMANNPSLRSARKMQSRDSLSYELARTSRIPDLNAGVWYGNRQAKLPDGSKAGDMVGFSVGFGIPLYYKQKQNPLIAESRINMQKSQSDVEAIENEVLLMVHHAISDVSSSGKRILLYEKQLIPQATANLNAGFIGYQQGKIDFMTLTDNLITLYKYRIQYYDLIADYNKAVAQLAMLTGKK